LSDQQRLSNFAQGKKGSTEWEKKTFSEVIEVNNYPPLEKGEEQTYVAMGDLDEYERKVKDTSKKEYKYSAHRFQNGDTLFPKMSRCLELGKTAYVDVLDEDEIAFGSTEFMVMRPKSKKVLPKFVYYTVRREDIRQHALSWATGSTARRQRISTDLFDNLTIKVPPIEEQEEIVGLLDAIDAKIETNNRINEFLEEIGQTLHRSWFIDFDPYNEFKNSELGEIPVGFSIKTIEELCSEIKNGGTPDRSNSDYWKDGNIPWAKTGELVGRPIVETEEHVTKEGLEESNCELASQNSVLVALYGSSVGNTGIVGKEMAFNQACCNLKPKSQVGYPYLVLTLKSLKPQLKNVSVGSAQQNISQGVIKEQKVAVPPTSDLTRFKQLLEPAYEFMIKSMRENVSLNDIRQLLLPKLMSGELRLDPENNNKPMTNE
jgi:type I restriction enzyme S subunit